MLDRHAAETVRTRLLRYPAVALVGPRQAGKTTLAQSFGGRYFDLEQPSERLRLDLSWADVTGSDALVVLDEAQSWPEVFPRLRGAIDADRRRSGRFLLLGSVAPALMVSVSESLAGRLSLVELPPLLRSELGAAERERHWLLGGYPDGGVLDPAAYPRWGIDYLALLAQRDLPAWGLPATPRVTDRLFRMLAAVHGQSWNASQIGASLGLSYHTVNSYLDYLEGAFLLRRLPPLHANLRKRIVKSPKVYWRDSGLLHALVGVCDEPTLFGWPNVGASWEGYVVDQAIGELTARGAAFSPFWFRTSDGYEIDLVLELAGKRWAIESKLTTSPSVADLKRLDKTANLIGADRRVLVSQVEEPAGDDERLSTHIDGMLEVLRAHAH